MNAEIVRAAFDEQAAFCRTAGSGLTAMICDLASTCLTHESLIGARILGWAGNPAAKHDNVPLRFAGALHALARAGHALIEHYPPNPLPSADQFWAAITTALHTEDRFIQSFLDFAPQTNEVMRSAVLMPGLLAVAAQYNLPLHLLELGASAGLNLTPDAYFYQWGLQQWGNPASPLHLIPDFSGGPIAVATLDILSRQGVDIHPLDITDDAARARLAAYVWADQPERLKRLEAALQIAARTPVLVETAEAADWLSAKLSQLPGQKSVRVVFHSIFWQYISAATKQRLTDLIETTGASATHDHPLAWLRFEEGRTTEIAPELRLRLWPGDKDHLLGYAHPHGRTLTWFG